MHKDNRTFFCLSVRNLMETPGTPYCITHRSPRLSSETDSFSFFCPYSQCPEVPSLKTIDNEPFPRNGSVLLRSEPILELKSDHFCTHLLSRLFTNLRTGTFDILLYRHTKIWRYKTIRSYLLIIYQTPRVLGIEEIRWVSRVFRVDPKSEP